MNIDSDFWKEARTITFGIIAMALIVALYVWDSVGSDQGRYPAESPEANTVVHTLTTK